MSSYKSKENTQSLKFSELFQDCETLEDLFDVLDDIYENDLELAEPIKKTKDYIVFRRATEEEIQKRIEEEECSDEETDDSDNSEEDTEENNKDNLNQKMIIDSSPSRE